MNKGVTLIFLPLVLSLLVMKHCQKVSHPDGRAYLFRKKIAERVMKSSSPDNESQVQLNRFLHLRDVSPVRHTLSVPWNTAHERTKRRYLRKAQQCISAMLDVLAPENSQELWTELCDRHAVCSESQVVVEGRSEKETELLNAFAESYLKAQHWSTRRQILSLMADKLSLREMREFIPTVNSYRYNIARRHRPIHGIAAPLQTRRKGECELNL